MSTTLSDGHEYRLVVGSRGHGAETVVTGGETTVDCRGQEALVVSGRVDTLEEGELLRVESVDAILAAYILDGDYSRNLSVFFPLV